MIDLVNREKSGGERRRWYDDDTEGGDGMSRSDAVVLKYSVKVSNCCCICTLNAQLINNSSRALPNTSL
jgi:hypothetical protein